MKGLVILWGIALVLLVVVMVGLFYHVNEQRTKIGELETTIDSQQTRIEELQAQLAPAPE